MSPGVGPEDGALASRLLLAFLPLVPDTYTLWAEHSLKPYHSLATYLSSPASWTGHLVYHCGAPLQSQDWVP